MTNHRSISQKPDGEEPRHRLIKCALRLFADKGFEATTTREIAKAAEVNISAIRYYFGDKASLYRAAFVEPMADMPCCSANAESYAGMPLAEGMLQLLKDFLEPLKHGELIRLVMKLHYRELLEPTGVWQEEIESEIKPQHDALVGMLQKHLRIEHADIDIHRLAFSIIGMPVHFYVGQDIVSILMPAMLADDSAIDLLAERLTGYALSMIDGEARRRAKESYAAD